MADRVITAEAIISAKDNTGDVFANLARKLQGVGKSAKASAEIEKMTSALEKQRQQLAALDKMQGARAKFGDARARFNAEKAAVESAAKAVAGAVKPTAEMTQALARQQAAVKRASAEFEKQTKAVLAAKHAAEGFGSPLSKMAADQTRLRASIESTTRAIEHQSAAELKAASAAARSASAHAKLEREQEKRAHGIAHHGVVNYALGGAAAAVSAHGIVGVGEKVIESGAELQHERVASMNAGRTPEELKRFEEAARRTAVKLPTASFTESMKTLLETTSSFGSVEHAIEHLDFMMRNASVLKASSGGKISDSAGEMGQKFAKFFEMRGVANDPERFQHEGSEMVRAMAATGGTFNPHEMFLFASQAKSALRNYDIDYLSRVVPSIAGETGGEKAGTAANAWYNVIMGKARDAKQAKMWMDAGLLDPKKVEMKKGQAVSWSAGAVKNTDLAMRNPLKWFEEVELPALRDKLKIDVDNTAELSKVHTQMYRNSMSNQFANENSILADRQRLHKDAALIDKTSSPDEMYKRNLHQDPLVAVTALAASFDSLSAAVTSPGMATAATTIASVSKALAQLAGVAAEHPIAAMAAGGATGTAALGGAGVMSYKLLNGFGLGSAAVELSGAAAALTAAAEKQGIGGLLGGPGGLAGKGAMGLAGRLAMMSPAVLALLGFDAAMITALNADTKANPKANRSGAKMQAAYKSIDEDAERKAGGHWEETAGRGRAGGGKRRWIAYDEFGARVRESFKHDAPVEPDTVPSGHWEGTPRAGRSGAGRRWVVDPIAGPAPFSNPMGTKFHADAGNIDSLPRIGGGPTGPIEAKVTGPVTAELKGQAAISVTVKAINADVVSQTSSSTGNIKVSTGGTMPTAKAATGSAPSGGQ